MLKPPGTPLKVLVVGCGYWGKHYVRIFNELPGSEVVAICDKRATALEPFKTRYPAASYYTDLPSAMAHPGVEAVIVCTVARTHAEVVTQCLQAGKHVLVEKPMTTSVADGDKLIALAGRQRRCLMVGHTFRYNAGVERLKGQLESPDFGRLQYMYARRTNLGPIRQDVSALWDLIPHDISMFNYLAAAEPEWVSAVGAQLSEGGEDVGFVTLGYPGGVVANVHASWADPNKVRELVCVGSKQRAVFDDTADAPVQVYNLGLAQQAEAAAAFQPEIEAREPLKYQSQHFLDAVAARRRPLTDGAEGLSVVRVMEAVDASVALNGAPVSVVREAVA